MVGGLVGDVARPVGRFQAADAVLESGRAGHGELPGQRVRITGVRLERLTLLGEGVLDLLVAGDVRNPPRLRAVGDRAVGQQHHRGVVLHSDPGGLQGHVEAVGRRARRQHGHRRFTVAAEHRLQQVGLFGLGRQTRRGAAALHVDDHQRQLGHHGQAHGLGLQRDAGAGGGGHAQRAAVGGADGRADAGDLVLGLEGQDVEVLVLGQLVQDVRGRGDRVRAQVQRQVRLARRGDQSVGQRQVAGDVPVGARGEGGRGRGDLVGDGEVLGGLAEVPARPEGGDVRVGHLGLLGELLPQERLGALGRPVVHPAQQAQREHVLGALGVPAGQARVLQGLQRQRGQRHRVDAVRLQRAVLQGVGGVAHLGHRALGELVGVDDDLRAPRQVRQVRLQGGRVHRHQHVGGVTGGEDVVVREVKLERRDAGQGAGGRADLGREVGQRGEVVAERRRLGGEAVTGQLHTVTGVTGEADDHPLQSPDLLRR